MRAHRKLRLAAVRAHVLERLARPDDAARAYRQAIRETRHTASGSACACLRRLGYSGPASPEVEYRPLM